MIYLEDFLEHYVEKIGVSDNNRQILMSINKQCKKGTALTDRQYALVKKCLSEVDGLEFTGLEPTRQPLREIDRSKYIKIVATEDVYGQDTVYESYKSDWKWIKVRFPFAKKTIIDLESVASKCNKFYFHKKGSHEHFFKLNEKTISLLLDVFKDKEFEIDLKLLEYYNQIEDIKQNPINYVPGFWFNDLTNLDDNAVQYIKNQVPDLDPIKLYDKRNQLGLSYITCDVPSGVVGKIITRQQSLINIDPKEYSLDKIIEGLYKLERLPVLVLVDADNELDQMTKVFNAFKHTVSNFEQVALFRVDNNNEEYNVNNFIADKVLNNWLDENTKIVYIKKDKLPKLLLKTNWKPQSVLELTGIREHMNVSKYVQDICDLIVCHDNQGSYFKRINFADL